MDLAMFSACVLTGSMGGAAAGLWAVRLRSRRRARRRGRGRTGRSWPGSRARPDDPWDDGSGRGAG
jgi:hypothetical protein